MTNAVNGGSCVPGRNPIGGAGTGMLENPVPQGSAAFCFDFLLNLQHGEQLFLDSGPATDMLWNPA